MDDLVLLLIIALAAANGAVLAVLLGRRSSQRETLDLLRDELERTRAALAQSVAQTQQLLHQDLSQAQQALASETRASREEIHRVLEQRLGSTFQRVDEALARVQEGLGEMRSLAEGVGDLRRVLANVKSRGTWAEVQLGALLEDMLAPGQFERNVHVVPGSAEVVEFAVRLPGPKDEPGRCVWLPIDAKLPQEDYQRLLEASDAGDAAALQQAREALRRAVLLAARDIHEKYVRPPHTTDFAVMYLGTEGLYAEVASNQGLLDELQRQRVMAAGPSTLAALLTSLSMGFQTLAIEERAAEVWRVLGAVKAEFGKFGVVLERLKKQLAAAQRTVEQAETRTRAMARRLREVEQLPGDEAAAVLALEGGEEGVGDEAAGETGGEAGDETGSQVGEQVDGAPDDVAGG